MITDFEILDDDDIWNMLENINEKSISKIDKNQCINCNSLNLVNDQSKGCIKCLDCGLCTNQTFDENAEWSNYDDGKSEGSVRCGAITNFFLPKSSLGTTIAGKNYSVLKMLQNWNQMPYKERSLSEILRYVEQVCRKINLPKAVIDLVKILYKQIHDLKYDTEEKKNKNVIIRGENRKGIYGATVYYAAQKQGYSRSIKEIADMFETSIKTITKGCRKFMDLMKKNDIVNTISTTSSNDFIDRFCYKLKLNKEQIEKITNMAINISKLPIASNHQPSSIVAGLVLIYSYDNNLDIQKKTISEIFDISIVTIDKIFKKIKPFINIITSEENTILFKNKLINAKYIMIDENILANTELFKQNMIDISETNISINLDNIEDFDSIEINIEKKKRGRKKKIIEVI